MDASLSPAGTFETHLEAQNTVITRTNSAGTSILTFRLTTAIKYRTSAMV